jgi:hypothetical protein
MNKVYESYYYRELRSGRTPIPEKKYLAERARGKRKVDGTYNAPTYEERLGLPRKFGKFIKNGKLDKKAIKLHIGELASKLDDKKIDRRRQSYIESRIVYYMGFLKK